MIGGLVELAQEGTVSKGALGFAAWYVVMGFGAAVLLHLRRAEAYLAAIPCMIVMLVLIPIGTVFGVLGLIWLNKGKVLLKRV